MSSASAACGSLERDRLLIEYTGLIINSRIDIPHNTVDAELKILYETCSSPANLLKQLRLKAHPCPPQKVGEADIGAGHLPHAVGEPVVNSVGCTDPRIMRILRIQISLDNPDSIAQIIIHQLQEVRTGQIIGIEHDNCIVAFWQLPQLAKHPLDRIALPALIQVVADISLNPFIAAGNIGCLVRTVITNHKYIVQMTRVFHFLQIFY